MTQTIQVIAALLTILAAGTGVTTLLIGRSERVGLTELAALSWLLGTAVVSLSLWCIGLIVHGAALHGAVTSICIALGIAAYVRRPRKGELVRTAGPNNIWTTVLVALLCLVWLVVFWRSLQQALGWDGLLVWELKARYAYLNGGALPQSYFVDASRAYSHPEYPLFLPLVETWLYFWLGECNQFWAKIVAPLFFAAGLILLTRATSKLCGKRWLGLLLTLIFALLPFLRSRLGGVVVGYADVPLSILYAAAVYYLLVFIEANSAAALKLFVTLVSLLPWLKREGAVLWLVAGCCGAIVIGRRKRLPTALLALLPGLAVILSWKIFLSCMQAPPPRDFAPISIAVIISNVHRVAPILESLAVELLRVDRWSVFWCAAAIALINLIARYRDEGARLLLIFVIAPVGLYCGTYLFSAWEEYRLHIVTSLPRLLLHVAPVALLSIALTLRQRGRQSELPVSSD
jgi:hypothetical protein